MPFIPNIGNKPLEAKKKKRRLYLSIFVVLAGFLFALFLFISVNLASQILLPQASNSHSLIYPWQNVTPSEKILLVMGVDAPGAIAGGAETGIKSFERTRTDTMMLVRVYGKDKRMSIVSIPRDSKVYLSHNHLGKINSAHAFGGPEKAVQTVQDAFGIPVDNFIVINFSALRKLVDAVGGIDITIDKRMRYKDHTAKLYIDFQPGRHHLNGEDAERFLRFRHDQHGDIGRIHRQQAFFGALAKKMTQPAMAMKIPSLFKQFHDSIETDLSQQSLLGLAVFVKQLQAKNIRIATIPGHPSQQEKVSYWIIDSYPAQLILDRLILGGEDNIYQSRALNKTSSIKVGLLSSPNQDLEKVIPKIRQSLEKQGYSVVCQQQSTLVKHSLIVEHTSRTSNEITETLRKLDKQLENARLIFAPAGTTFEKQSCSANEDYTLLFTSTN